MSFISKVELKYQLEKMGITVEGNYVKKSEIMKVVAETPKILCPKIDNKHKEAFWYYGKRIATCDSWYAEATGEIRVSFDGKTSFKNEAAVKEALRRKLTDKELLKLDWENNNWFEINQDGDDDEGFVEHTYDEAIAKLKEMAAE